MLLELLRGSGGRLIYLSHLVEMQVLLSFRYSEASRSGDNCHEKIICDSSREKGTWHGQLGGRGRGGEMWARTFIGVLNGRNGQSRLSRLTSFGLANLNHFGGL